MGWSLGGQYSIWLYLHIEQCLREGGGCDTEWGLLREGPVGGAADVSTGSCAAEPATMPQQSRGQEDDMPGVVMLQFETCRITLTNVNGETTGAGAFVTREG
jgi:hypothetical protein